MDDVSRKQHSVKMEYFDNDQPGKEQTGNHMDIYSAEIQPPSLEELLDAKGNERACI